MRATAVRSRRTRGRRCRRAPSPCTAPRAPRPGSVRRVESARCAVRLWWDSPAECGGARSWAMRARNVCAERQQLRPRTGLRLAPHRAHAARALGASAGADGAAQVAQPGAVEPLVKLVCGRGWRRTGDEEARMHLAVRTDDRGEFGRVAA